MTVSKEKNHPELLYDSVGDTVSFFYWNVFKQNAFWLFCLFVPSYIVFIYFSYDYIRGGIITRWEMSKMLNVAFFTLLPAGMFLNRVLYYHAYNLIINLANNFSTPYKLGEKFDDFLSESVSFFFKFSVPFIIISIILYYALEQSSTPLWLLVTTLFWVVYEIACCTYGLRVTASVSRGYRVPSDWRLDASIAFLKSNIKQVISYAAMSTICSMLLVFFWTQLVKVSSFVALIFMLFAGSLFVIFRATLHAKLLVNTDWNFVADDSPVGDASLGKFVKKNFALGSGVLALVLMFVGYSSYQDSKYSDGRLIPEAITPTEREAGTLDYTLIDWIFRDKKYFEHWALRIPEDAAVTLPTDVKSKGYNSRLSLYLKMPDMGFLPQGQDRFDKDVMRVSINARHQKFKTSTRRGNKTIEVGFAGTRHHLTCVKEKQITKGFFQMRDATAEEINAYGSSYKHYLKDKCGYSAGYTNFAYYNDAGDLLAAGKCSLKDFFKSNNASCDFRVWLPQGRDAYVYLAPKYLKDFPQIYKRLVAKINDATIVEHSTNLKWRPSKKFEENSIAENAATALPREKTKEPEPHSQYGASKSNLFSDVKISLSGCEIPAVNEKDTLILLGAYDGSAMSNVTILGQDKETTAEEIFIGEGAEPIYLVITSFDNMIWRVSGATARIRKVVLSSASGRKNGIVGSGVTGVHQSKVSFLRNPENCIQYFRKRDSDEAEQAKGILRSITGRNPDQIIGTETLNFAKSNGLYGDIIGRSRAQLIEFDPADVVSETSAELYEVLPGEAGLSQLIREGKIERVEPKRYRDDEFFINEKIRFPTGLYGANSVTFYISEDVPRPIGRPGHSTVCSVEYRRDIYSDRLCNNSPPERN